MLPCGPACPRFNQAPGEIGPTGTPVHSGELVEGSGRGTEQRWVSVFVGELKLVRQCAVASSSRCHTLTHRLVQPQSLRERAGAAPARLGRAADRRNSAVLRCSTRFAQGSRRQLPLGLEARVGSEVGLRGMLRWEGRSCMQRKRPPPPSPPVTFSQRHHRSPRLPSRLPTVGRQRCYPQNQPTRPPAVAPTQR